jgi:hypothetical protein
MQFLYSSLSPDDVLPLSVIFTPHNSTASASTTTTANLGVPIYRVQAPIWSWVTPTEDVYIVNTQATREMHDSDAAQEHSAIRHDMDPHVHASGAIRTSRVRLLLRDLALSKQIAAYTCIHHACSVEIWLDVTLVDTKPCRSVCANDPGMHHDHDVHADQSAHNDDQESSHCTLVCDMPEYMDHVPEGQHTVTAQLVAKHDVHLAAPTRVHFVVKYIRESLWASADSESASATNLHLDDVDADQSHDKVGHLHSNPKSDDARHHSDRVVLSHQGHAHAQSTARYVTAAATTTTTKGGGGGGGGGEAHAQSAANSAGQSEKDGVVQAPNSAAAANYAATRHYGKCAGRTPVGRNAEWDACVAEYVAMMRALDRGATDLCKGGAKQTSARPCMNALVYR